MTASRNRPAAPPAAPLPGAPAPGAKILLDGDSGLRQWWLRRHLPGAHRFQLGGTADASDRARLLDAAHGGLFAAPAPLVVEADAGVRLDVALLGELAATPATVVLNCGRTPAGSTGFERLRLSGPGDSARAWQDLAGTLGVTLDRAAADFLRRSCRDDTARGLGVLDLCELGRIHQPTTRQLQALLVSSPDTAAPWLIGDRIEAGRPDAVELCEQTEPLALHAYLARRWSRALQLCEGGQPGDTRDQRLVEVGRRLGADRLRRALVVLASGDLLVKQYGQDGLRILVTRLSRLFADA